MENGELLNWILSGVVIIVSTLAAVVGFLYRVTQTQHTREIAQLQTAVTMCEEERHQIRTDLDALKDQLLKRHIITRDDGTA